MSRLSVARAKVGTGARAVAGTVARAVAGAIAGALDRLTAMPQRLPVLAAGAVITVAAVALIVLSPLPGRGDAPRLALEFDVLPPPLELPESDETRRLAGSAPARSPAAGPPTQPAGEFVGWAILDRQTGSIFGSATMTEVSTTASMIKAWITADYLRRSAETGGAPTRQRLSQLELVIRDSNNDYAETIFRRLGAHESIERLVRICGLTDSQPYRDFWSNTQLSPRDTARMGDCIADGRAAGPEWTDWLLEQMRQVRGVGDFGIRHALPEPERSGVAIKNGWINRDYDGNWHVNCLAIGETWTMGVMTRYPVRLGYEHGTQICQSIADEYLPLLLAP